MRTSRSSLVALCLISVSAVAAPSSAAEPSAPRKVRAAFSALAGSMAPPWVALESGLFRKHGLEVEIMSVPSGAEGMNALIAGELDFLQVAADTTAGAAVGGADVVIVATTIGTLVQALMSRPEIEKAAQLRGKAVGISRFGTSVDAGARLALRHFGLTPDKDVAIVQVGASASIVAAMQGNRVQAGLLPYPAVSQAKRLGFRTLLDLASLGIPYATTGVTTRGKLVRGDPDLVRRYLSAQVEAIARMKRDRAFTLIVMGKYLRTNDPELLAETYDVYVQKHLLKVPVPTTEGVNAVLDELARRNPKAHNQDPRRLFDDSFVRRLEASGFIENLYR